MTSVFISYRRDDTRWPAKKVYESFCRVLPQDRVFMDVDSIPLGQDFVKYLNDRVSECDILLALIGPNWVRSRDPDTGERRLQDPNDFVRIEIAAALKRGIPVVPVLLDGARMPKRDDLPAELGDLVLRNGELIDLRSFNVDAERLMRRLGLHREASRFKKAAKTAPPAPAPHDVAAPQVVPAAVAAWPQAATPRQRRKRGVGLVFRILWWIPKVLVINAFVTALGPIALWLMHKRFSAILVIVSMTASAVLTTSDTWYPGSYFAQDLGRGLMYPLADWFVGGRAIAMALGGAAVGSLMTASPLYVLSVILGWMARGFKPKR